MKNQTLRFYMLIELLLSLTLTSCGGGSGHSNNGDNNGENPPIVIEDYKYTKAVGDIRLMTYNSYYCKSNSATQSFSEAHTKDFADVIKALSPDVIAIQELDSFCTHRGQRYLLEDIKKATGIDYQIFFGSAANYDGGRIGCGLMVKKTLEVKKAEIIPLPGNEQRALIKVQLPKFTFLATHLDLNNLARKNSADIINKEAKAETQPVFLAGDLNDSPAWAPDQSAFPALLQTFTIVSETAGSLPGQPGTTIDYILLDTAHTGNITVKKTKVVKRLSIEGDQKDISTVSDHYPVFVDIQIK